MKNEIIIKIIFIVILFIAILSYIFLDFLFDTPEKRVLGIIIFVSIFIPGVYGILSDYSNKD